MNATAPKRRVRIALSLVFVLGLLITVFDWTFCFSWLSSPACSGLFVPLLLAGLGLSALAGTGLLLTLLRRKPDRWELALLIVPILLLATLCNTLPLTDNAQEEAFAGAMGTWPFVCLLIWGIRQRRE